MCIKKDKEKKRRGKRKKGFDHKLCHRACSNSGHFTLVDIQNSTTSLFRNSISTRYQWRPIRFPPQWRDSLPLYSASTRLRRRTSFVARDCSSQANSREGRRGLSIGRMAVRSSQDRSRSVIVLISFSWLPLFPPFSFQWEKQRHQWELWWG